MMLGSQCSPCCACPPFIAISIIDEDSSYGRNRRNSDWACFRRDYPTAPFFLLEPKSPSYGPGALREPCGWDGIRHEVSRDNGNAGLATDYYSLLDLESLLSEYDQIVLAVDNSGSMTVNTVRASLQMLYSKLQTLHGIDVPSSHLGTINNESLIVKFIGSDENYIFPHLLCRPCPLSTGQEETRIYGYFDTIPPAPPFCDCPCEGNCDTGLIEKSHCETAQCDFGTSPASCCGATLDAYVRSRDFIYSSPDLCGNPRARVFIWSALRDSGTIQGQDQTISVPSVNCGTPGIVGFSVTLIPFVVDNGDGTIYLKLNVSVQNGQNICGPYGVESLTVRWFFE